MNQSYECCETGLNGTHSLSRYTAKIGEEGTFINESIWSKENIKEMFFTSSGRLNRRPYIIRELILSVGSLVSTGLLKTDVSFLSLIAILISVGVAISGIMLSIRRCHDIDKSGWFVLLCLIPIVNIIIGFVLL